MLEPTLTAETVTYTCTTAEGEIQYPDRNGNWQTLPEVKKGHVFVGQFAWNVERIVEDSGKGKQLATERQVRIVDLPWMGGATSPV